MAFDMKNFKENISQNKNDAENNIKTFIDKFTEIIESEEFEDWLQKQLEYTSKKYNELYFYMGINYESGRDTTFSLCIGQDDNFVWDNIVDIQIGNEYIGTPDYAKEKQSYLNAITDCWKLLKQRCRSLGLDIITSEPNWDINYERIRKKIEVNIIND